VNTASNYPLKMLKVNAFLHQLKIQKTVRKTAKPEEATESKT
jgi:hypothetical protein